MTPDAAMQKIAAMTGWRVELETPDPVRLARAIKSRLYQRGIFGYCISVEAGRAVHVYRRAA